MPFEKLTNSLLLVDLLMLGTWISSIIRTQFPITHVSEREVPFGEFQMQLI